MRHECRDVHRAALGAFLQPQQKLIVRTEANPVPFSNQPHVCGSWCVRAMNPGSHTGAMRHTRLVGWEGPAVNTFTRFNVEISTGSSRLASAGCSVTSAAYSASVETNVGGVDEDAYTPTITLFAAPLTGVADEGVARATVQEPFTTAWVVTTNLEAVCSVRLADAYHSGVPRSLWIPSCACTVRYSRFIE